VVRPVVEIMFVDFFGVCFDQVMNNMAKFRYMYGGKASTPITVRTSYGAGFGAAAQHSQALYPIFAHVPGIKVALPSNAYDAKGLLAAAIRDEDPVLFFEHKGLYDEACEVPDESYVLPFGEAAIVREGGDCCIVAFGRMVLLARQAADILAREGIEVTIVDPRTIAPLDEDLLAQSVRRTHRALVIDGAPRAFGVTGEIASCITEAAFDWLDAPVGRLGAADAPVPISRSLEPLVRPDANAIAAAARALLA